MATALLAGILTLIAVNLRRLTALSASMNAGANASVLPVLNAASMVGFGAVIAAVPAFELVSAAFLSLDIDRTRGDHQHRSVLRFFLVRMSPPSRA